MLIERDGEGNFILDPVELAVRFELSPDDFRRKMQQGLLVSTVEVGVEDEAGTCRLSIRLGNRIWRAVVGADDQVMDEALRFVRGNMLRRDRED